MWDRSGQVSIAFRLFKRLVYVVAPGGRGGRGEVSIAFRLFKRLVSPIQTPKPGFIARCLNSLSAVQAIGIDSFKHLKNTVFAGLNSLSAVQAIGIRMFWRRRTGD